MDVATTYMGLSLKNPIVPSASPLSTSIDYIRLLEDCGAGAIVMYSLFQEQLVPTPQDIDPFPHLSGGAQRPPRPSSSALKTSPDEYLDLLGRARRAVDIPIIGSLNGISPGTWLEYAARLQEVGADGLELNLYYLPTDPRITSTQVEELYLEMVRETLRHVSIPVAVKLTPYFTATANMAYRLVEAGAAALVLFNRFYQPDFNLETMQTAPHLVYSNSADLRLPLNWVAILAETIPADLAITGGIHTHEDVLKSLVAGAKVSMMASELLNHGTHRIGEILKAMEHWMERHGYTSLAQLHSRPANETTPSPLERASYIQELASWHPFINGQFM